MGAGQSGRHGQVLNSVVQSLHSHFSKCSSTHVSNAVQILGP